jgi:hypothetical protein
VGVAGCARPGPQVPDAMPTSIARQVSEWQVRESEVRECVLVINNPRDAQKQNKYNTGGREARHRGQINGRVVG